MESGRLRDRLLRALLEAAEARGRVFQVSAWQEPLVVVELPEDGAAVALVDHSGVRPDELRSALVRLLEAHRAGLLYLVVAGGGADARAAVEAADRGAPDPNRLGAYHVTDDGNLERVAGRRLGLLAEAGRALPHTLPLDTEGLTALLHRAERERQEAVRFASTISGRPQRATLVLGAACIVLFGLVHLWEEGSRIEILVRAGANSAQFVELGELWRLLSHAFLHANAMHLVMNLLGLLAFGGFLESLLGWHRYLVLYALAALGGGVASALVAGRPLSVGASGAVWGLMAAGVGLALVPGGRARGPRSRAEKQSGSPDSLAPDGPPPGGRRVLPRAVAARMRPRLIGLIVVNAAFSLMPGIDFAAHLGGGVAGFALALTPFLHPPHARWSPTADPAEGRRTTAPERLPIRAAGYVAALALAAAVALALLTGRPWEAKPRLPRDDAELVYSLSVGSNATPAARRRGARLLPLPRPPRSPRPGAAPTCPATARITAA